MRPRVLLVDDDAAIRFAIGRYLESKGYDVVEADAVASALEAFRTSGPDAAVLDYELPDGNALDLLKRLKELEPQLTCVVLTGHGSIDLAVRAVKEGAEHFLTKPPDMTALTLTLQRALQARRLARQHDAAVRKESVDPDPFLGDTEAVRALAERARRVAGSDLPVLILGETGSGKGVLARWLHAHSARREEALVELNCAGMQRELLESELFGHERGAFTGAVAAKPGLLETAHRGTLFLDEIGDMELAVQPKLLKAVEDGAFRRVGETRQRSVDVRLLAATHRDLDRLVQEGKFREDLLFRINAVTLTVPPLRERIADVPLLARWMMERRNACRGKQLSDGALARLATYPWPGNVRELRNVLERAAVLARHPVLEADDLLFGGAAAAPRPAPGLGLGPGPGGADGALCTLDELERRHIERALAAAGGRVQAAAELLGVPRSTLYDKLKQHGIRTARAPAAPRSAVE